VWESEEFWLLFWFCNMAFLHVYQHHLFDADFKIVWDSYCKRSFSESSFFFVWSEIIQERSKSFFLIEFTSFSHSSNKTFLKHFLYLLFERILGDKLLLFNNSAKIKSVVVVNRSFLSNLNWKSNFEIWVLNYVFKTCSNFLSFCLKNSVEKRFFIKWVYFNECFSVL
jgi:hypothetical protein